LHGFSTQRTHSGPKRDFWPFPSAKKPWFTCFFWPIDILLWEQLGCTFPVLAFALKKNRMRSCNPQFHCVR